MVRCACARTSRFASSTGKDIPWVQQIDRSLHAVAGPNAICVDSPFDLHSNGQQHEAAFTIRAGEEIAFVLSWYHSNEDAPRKLDASRALSEAEAYWEQWSEGIARRYGEWDSLARRSLITLQGAYLHSYRGDRDRADDVAP